MYRVLDKEKEEKKADISGGASTVKEATLLVYGSGGKLEFCGMDSEGFRKNLRKVDSNFPEIMAEILKHYYSGKGPKLSDLVDCLVADKEFSAKIDFTKEDLVFKVKKFLCEVALGMTPKKEWDGFTKAHGGYIIVKKMAKSFVIICITGTSLRTIFLTTLNLIPRVQ